MNAAVQARAIARQLGQWMKIDFLWSRAALRLRFNDDSALLLHREGATLDRPAGKDSQAIAFGRAHARQRNWLFLPALREWPLGCRGQRGEWLTASREEMLRLRAKVFDAAVIRQLPESQLSLPHLILNLDGLSPETVPAREERLRTRHAPRWSFLVVTTQCTSTNDPGLDAKLAWLERWQADEPGLRCLFLDTEAGDLRRSSVEEMASHLRRMVAQRDIETPSGTTAAWAEVSEFEQAADPLPEGTDMPEPESMEDCGPSY